MAAEPTAAVLRNRGAPIELLVLDSSGEVEASPDGEPVYESRWVRFNANHIAEIEDWTEEYEPAVEGARPVRRDKAQVLTERLTDRRTQTLRFLLSLALGVEEREIGARMDPALRDAYATAVGVAYALSEGTDPKVALRIWTLGIRGATGTREGISGLVGELLASVENLPEDATPGPIGSGPGAPSDEASTSSGA